MSDDDVFETRFAAAYRRYLDEVPTAVDAGAVARAVAAAQPHARAASPWASLFKHASALVWLVLVGLLLAAIAAGLAGGAHPQPRALSCPPGTNPDVPGPVDQPRPPTDGWTTLVAFDRRAGRVVLVAPNSEIWTFDVCTNSWERSHARSTPETGLGALVYDAGSEAMIAVGEQVAVYDREADRWTAKGVVPEVVGPNPRLVYDSGSGLVVARSPTGGQWTYELETDTWTRIAESPPSAGEALIATRQALISYDASVDQLVMYGMSVDPRANSPVVRLFDIRTGTWTTPSATPPDMNFNGWGELCVFCVSGNEIAYDEATQQTIVVNYGRMIAFDASTDEWRVLDEGMDPNADPRGYDDPTYRIRHAMLYDPINERLIVYGGTRGIADGSLVYPDDVLAFDPVTRQWTTLLEAGQPRPVQ